MYAAAAGSSASGDCCCPAATNVTPPLSSMHLKTFGACGRKCSRVGATDAKHRAICRSCMSAPCMFMSVCLCAPPGRLSRAVPDVSRARKCARHCGSWSTKTPATAPAAGVERRTHSSSSDSALFASQLQHKRNISAIAVSNMNAAIAGASCSKKFSTRGCDNKGGQQCLLRSWLTWRVVPAAPAEARQARPPAPLRQRAAACAAAAAPPRSPRQPVTLPQQQWGCERQRMPVACLPGAQAAVRQHRGALLLWPAGLPAPPAAPHCRCTHPEPAHIVRCKNLAPCITRNTDGMGVECGYRAANLLQH